jgi:hypothetical protein
MPVLSCCVGFEIMLEAAGQRGLSVIATEEAGERGFRLQARACDAADIPALVERLRRERGGEGSIALVAQKGMRYCLFCGADLDQLISHRPDGFVSLLEKHRQFAFESM